jgi:hypothetical protein
MKVDGIFNIKNNQKEQEHKNMYYCLIGKEDFLDESGNPRINSETHNDLMAKALLNKPSKHMGGNINLQYRYYIRTKQNNIIFDPVEILSTVKNKESFAFINNVCKGGVQFTEVTQSVFNEYVTYLRTKNSRWLKSAQREIK